MAAGLATHVWSLSEIVGPMLFARLSTREEFKNPLSMQPATQKTPEAETSFLHIMAKPSDKARWVRAASQKQQGLKEWATEALNDCAEAHKSCRISSRMKRS